MTPRRTFVRVEGVVVDSFAPEERPGLERMRADVEPGVCPFCLEEIPPKPKGLTGRKSKYCGAPECYTAYHRTYKRDYRRAKNA